MGITLGYLSTSPLIIFYCSCIFFQSAISQDVVGLCLAYMLTLPEELSELIIDYTQLENDMVSFERVKSFINIPTEQPLQTIHDKKYPNFPLNPSIKFTKVFMKYRPNTENVLKGLSFEIPAGKRVGIVGRTGSGKSSIFAALLRIIELNSGVITIDNINIALLGLTKLRESITFIPQDPLVFTGSLKENLDPFQRFDNKVIEKVLFDVQLKFGLDYEIKNSGQNISIGERQVISLCRALISNTKILLFDETTAGIDPEMDLKIQKIIKNQFSQCTILTIAHRLGTILDNDLIVLLADGKVKEIGKTDELLNKDSEFSRLCKKNKNS